MVTNNLVKKSVEFSQNKNEEVLVKADRVSKKFCRSLKKALWYGVQDIGSEIIGRKYDHKLRPDEFWAVNDISFEVKRGECLGLIGPNGAGKSTLLKMLNGLIKPDQGSIMMRGRVSALIELTAGFNPILTGLENIYNRAAILGLSKAEINRKLDDIVEFAEIKDFLHAPVQSYSSGMRVRLGFAVAAQMEPDVLILDEVLAVGDVGFRAKCLNQIHEIMENAAVIFVTHTMPQISRVCSDILVINQGKTIFLGKEVAEGIDKFYSFFYQTKCHPIKGSQKAKIHKVYFESQGKEVNLIKYLDYLSVCIEVTIDPLIREASINLAWVDQNLQIIAQTMSYYNDFIIKNHSGNRQKIKADLGKINFNAGLYSLVLIIVEGKQGEILTGFNNLLELRVQGAFYGHAPVQLVSNWRIEEV